jgi:hypothetical protein
VGGVDADYGDSIPNAVEKFVEIGTKWVPVTISLKSYNRQHIINGFGWVSNWDAGPAEFFIDELRFEQ